MAQKGTDYLPDKISASDLVCRVGRPLLLSNVQGALFTGPYQILSVYRGRGNVFINKSFYKVRTQCSALVKMRIVSIRCLYQQLGDAS